MLFQCVHFPARVYHRYFSNAVSRLHPRLRQFRKAQRQEDRVRKEGIQKYNERFNSKVKMHSPFLKPKCPVILTANTTLMDSEYLASSVCKAASVRKLKIVLWKQFEDQTLNLIAKRKLDPKHIGHLNYGFAKVQYMRGLKSNLYSKLLTYIVKNNNFIKKQIDSNGLMTTVWLCQRIGIDPTSPVPDRLLASISNRITKEEDIKPADFIKSTYCFLCVCLV